MKSLYKNLSGLLVAAALSATFTHADAQRGFHGGFAVRSRGFGTRGGLAFRGGYTGPRLGYGFRHYYGFYAYPRIGFSIGATLPLGYYSFYFGPHLYFYNDGIFYTQTTNGYQVATPPIGAEIPKLPKGAQSIMIDGQQYFELDGVYYKPQVDADGKQVFVVAGKDGVLNTDNGNTQVDSSQQQMPHVGDLTDTLPDGSRKVTLNGKQYWITPEDIYLEETTIDNHLSYRVVSVPTDEDNQDNNQ